MLTLTNIKKSYSIGPVSTQILKGVDLEVGHGEMLAILGESGSGKSTLMNIIGLLDRPDSGTYSIEGEEITYQDDNYLSDTRNQKLGFVFQQYHLLPRLDALANVGRPLTYRGVSKAEIEARSLELLKKVNLDDKSHHKPREMSGGQQQRVAIARALVGSPSLILADEPTGALDTKVGREIMELFIRLNHEENITIVIITHDHGIADQCERKVIMEEGRL